MKQLTKSDLERTIKVVDLKNQTGEKTMRKVTGNQVVSQGVCAIDLETQDTLPMMKRVRSKERSVNSAT